MGDAPSDRADEIEVDNGAPCYSFGLKCSGGVEELEFCEMSERGNICATECLLAQPERASDRYVYAPISHQKKKYDDGRSTYV